MKKKLLPNIVASKDYITNPFSQYGSVEGFHNRSSFSFSCKKIYVLKNGLIIVIKVDKIHIKEKSVFCDFCISTLHTAIPHIFTTKNVAVVIYLILKCNA